MSHICFFRLRLMYRGLPVKILAGMITLLTAILLAGLYQGTEEASKLKIGIHFESPSEVTDNILRSLENNEILSPRLYDMDSGMRAVRESRIEALFVFKPTMEVQISEEDFEDLVDVYFLDENYLPYLLTDIVGSELIGEIAVTTTLSYFEGALDEVGRDEYQDQAYMKDLKARGLADMINEKDNFHVKKTYINDKNITVNDVVLNNELLFRQVIYGVVYIFAAFYWMFLGVSIVSDREVGIGQRWYTTGMKGWQVYLGEALSLWLGGLPIILAITAVEVCFDGHALYYLSVNLLYALAYASLIYMLTNIMSKVTVYVLGVTAIILVGGVVSGSFFALDPSSAGTTLLTFITPAHHMLTALTELMVLSLDYPPGYYAQQMMLYTSIMLVLGAVIRGVRRRVFRG